MEKKLLYVAEYSRSNNSKCKGCKKVILKDVLRLAYLQKALKFDGRERKFYHPCCFFKKYRPQSQFNIDGFAKLRNKDQETLKKLINVVKRNRKKRARQCHTIASSSDSENTENALNGPATKKMKSDSEDVLDTLIRTQNEELHDLREKIKEGVDKDSLISILKYNQQSVPRDKVQVLDHVTDIVRFGAIVPCKVENCSNGNFVFDGNTSYRCTGQLSGFGNCNKRVKEPERRPVILPPDILDEYPFLKTEFKAEHRAIKDNPRSSSTARRKLKPKEISSNSKLNKEMLVKDGAIVDPDSGLQNIAHVYIANGKPYSVALDKVDLSVHVDQNSYYKLQLLESDAGNPKSYWIYRSWGRINEKNGDDKCEKFFELDKALNSFHTLYRKKTGNFFDSMRFEKKTGRYYQLPTSSKSIGKVYKQLESNTLPETVQDLLKLLMNKDIMSAVMVMYSLDVIKMPLGKLKREQIINAFKILLEIRQKIADNKSHESLVEASNRFYSLIPHKACSADTLIELKNVKDKAEMLKDLNGIQFAYEFVYKTGESGKYAIDDFYCKLNTTIEPLDKNSEQFNIIKESIDNTKLEYDLEVEDIFEIQRQEENDREMFNKIPNRKLLWHGSRITNINLILAHGLRIAPREAFVIGCTLGKGLYFSDVVGNSAEYCYARQSNNIGIVLLCEVALGDSLECFDPENIDELPPSKHSVHGVGKISPQSNKLIDNVKIPCGKLIKDDSIDTFFDYSEFVVYKNQQVKIKYLVKLRFSVSERDFN